VRYASPTDLGEALDIRAEHGEDAKVMAGGQSLLLLLREHLVDPSLLVSLRGIEALRRLEVNGSARISAMVTHAEVERHPAIRQRWPLLARAEAAVSTVQVRNRGTLCGNIAHGYPTADPPAALIASDATVHLRSKRGGERQLPVESFFVGLLETAARPDELVTGVSLPLQPAGARWAYLKYALRPLDFAIVGVGVRLVLGEDGAVREARVGLNGAANHTLRAAAAEKVLVGAKPKPELLQEAGEAAARESDPLGDTDGSAEYKRRVIAVYTRRALQVALA
jgi:aerobic carbon-monoxide dehydrogenase medium subunit